MNKRIVCRAVVAALACLALVMVAACKTNAPQKDAFVEKWRTLAEQSEGHSPQDDGVPIDVDERNLKLEEGYEDVSRLLEDLEVEKPLPKIPVSLEMRRANLTAVIAALAKAANVSVMISPEVSGTVTVNVMRKPWDEVFEGVLKTNGLAYSWEGDILRVKTLADIENDIEITAAKARDMVQNIMLKKAEPPVTRIIRLRYTSAESMRATIMNVVFHQEVTLARTEQKKDVKGGEGEESVLEDIQDVAQTKEEKDERILPGYVWTDQDTNALIVQAPRPIMKVIYYLVRKIDHPRKQIKIKAYIVETDSETARELGVRWSGYYHENVGSNDTMTILPGASTYGTGLSNNSYAMNFPLSLEDATTRGTALGFLFGSIGKDILEFQLLALAEDNKVKILSSPSLTTQDNKEALLKDGMEIPYVTGYDDQGRASVEWKEAVLALRITPHIIDETNLHMQIQIKKDEVDFNLSNVEGIPVIRKKLAETELVTRNDETIVIGGLTKRRIDNTDSGVPYLKDVPVLGWVFKQDLKDDEQSEVLIFITPHILDYWTPDDIQKSFEQIDRELKEDGFVLDGGNGDFMQSQ